MGWLLPFGAVFLLFVGGIALQFFHPGPPRASDAEPVPRPVGLLPNQMGIATGSQLWAADAATLDRDLAGVAGLGARWLRAAVRWDGVEPERAGDANWRKVDALVAAAERHHLRLLVTISGTPRWARPADDPRPSAFAADPEVYGAFVGRLVAHCEGRVAAWELGNEPNHTKSFAVPDPARYARFLRAGYTAVKQADPGATVLSGGIGGTNDADGDIPGDTFVAALYELGANRSFDALSYHPYTYPMLPSQDRGERGWSRMRDVRRIMVDHGDAAKPIWITEFGAPTGGPSARRSVSEDEQRLILRDSYRLVAPSAWAGPLFWYSFRDAGDDPDAQSDHFGVVRSDGSEKPAAREYRAIARAAVTDR